jgi:hypothetical protein
LSKHPTFRLTLPVSFGVTLRRRRSESHSPAAVRRTLHLLARFAIAASFTSSAAAFDAGHISCAAVMIAARNHASEIPSCKTRPDDGPFIKSRPALGRELAIQAIELQEIGKQ